ncbi:hypothetical protein J437_LFUL008552 [Ladona fulva]|uniref:Amino acid transporter transmembrane domain-containing protein n=1 Tax=Ladona fulva TaxID=123851 RepID=A0A8K0KCN3_LADFU|nr:hypothetical protein J437_LFUL008552 [Ladona fulva]
MFLLLNYVIGPSIMHISMAFRSTDYLPGGIIILFATLFMIHGNRLWVRCMHEVNYRAHVSTIGYEDVLILTFGLTTDCAAVLYKYIRLFIHIIVIGTNGWLGVHHLAISWRMLTTIFGDNEVFEKLVIPLIIIIPIILFGFIPSWKIVAWICGLSVFMRAIFYIAVFIFTALQPMGQDEETAEDEVLLFSKNDVYYRSTYGLILIISALQTIGLLPVVENNMKNPHHLVGKRWLIGLNDVALVASALLHGACGYLGYSRFMAKKLCYYVFESITPELWLRNVAEIIIALSLIGSVSAPLYLIYEIVLGYLYHYFLDTPLKAAIIVKVIISVAMLFGIFGAYSTTDTMLEALHAYLVGLFCISLPAVLDNVLYWKKRRTIPYLRKPYTLATKYIPVKKNVSRGLYILRLLKNVVVFFAGIIILVVNTLYVSTYEKEGKYSTRCRLADRLFNITKHTTVSPPDPPGAGGQTGDTNTTGTG